VELAADLHLVEGSRGANVYLVLGEEPFLVDTGLPGSAEPILAYLDRIGLDRHGLAAIVLTHHDVDHVGSAAPLRRATGAQVCAPALDAPYILGERPRPGLKGLLPTIIRLAGMRLEPVPVDRLLQPGDTLPQGFTVLATPGHTPGHIALHRPGILLAGDLVQSADDGRALRPSPPLMSASVRDVAASIRAVSALPCAMVLPGHGRPVLGGGDELLAALVR
jgi:glyoxylase-like metal-dependent hydrolase (beta-lactamase superfamily II)